MLGATRPDLGQKRISVMPFLLIKNSITVMLFLLVMPGMAIKHGLLPLITNDEGRTDTRGAAWRSR